MSGLWQAPFSAPTRSDTHARPTVWSLNGPLCSTLDRIREDMDWPHYKVKICIQEKKEDEFCTFNQHVYSCSYFFPFKLSPFSSRKKENCSRFAVGVYWGPYWPSCLFVVVPLNPLIGKLPQTPAS